MLRPIYTTQFAKDLKRMLKRGKKPEKIKKVMAALVDEQQLHLYRPYRRCYLLLCSEGC